jgi:hypothetical protein
MAGFLFRLQTADGVAADPPTLETAVPNWRAGDTIPLGHKTLRVVAVRDDDANQPPVLIVEKRLQARPRSTPRPRATDIVPLY